MSDLNENEISPLEIDLGAGKRGEVNEIFLQSFGWIVKSILRSMFGGSSIPVNIKGSREEISSFAKTLGREKKYMKAVAKYGLNDPRIYKDKYKLRKAVANFERTTGIKYPFKG